MALQSLRPIPKVLETIVFNVQDIISSQVRLAKTELVEDTIAAARLLLVSLAGLLLMGCAVEFVLLAGVYALGREMELWLAAGLVGVLSGAVGAVLIKMAVTRLKKIRVGPEKTIESVKETVQWVKDQTK